MSKKFSTSQLEAYLDEALPTEQMSEVEDALRTSPALVEELVTINGRRDAGMHSLGDVWRRERIGCRYCAANLADLKAQHAEADSGAKVRREKYFHSSAGYLKSRRR